MCAAQCLADLKACKQSNIPVYSFAEHQRLGETKYLYGAAVIIGANASREYRLTSLMQTTAEGIMALHDPQLRQLYDLKVRLRANSKRRRLMACETDFCSLRFGSHAC